MTRRWPDTLPEPSWPDFGIEAGTVTLRSEMETGPAKVRRTTFVETDTVSPEWRMTDEQFWAFRSWYYDRVVGAWGSDSLTGWTFTGASAAVAPVPGPMGEPVDALVEDGSTGLHRAEASAEIVPAGTPAMVWASLRAQLRSRATVEIVNRGGVVRGAVVDLAAGVIESTTGVTSAVLTPRGNGWWRLQMQAAMGSGGTAPVVRIAAMDAGGASYAGGSAAALSLAELQVRQAVEGRKLFVPAGADGRALGAGAAVAWFRTRLPFGGGLTDCEARFMQKYAAKPLQGLNWQVKGVLEVRDA